MAIQAPYSVYRLERDGQELLLPKFRAPLLRIRQSAPQSPKCREPANLARQGISDPYLLIQR